MVDSYNSKCLKYKHLNYNYFFFGGKTMEDSLHYLIMANQMLVQRGLLERLKNTGLTIGQPKVLDYLKDHDGSSQKEIARNCF